MNVDGAIDTLLKIVLTIFPNNTDSDPDHEARTRRLSESVASILQSRGIPLDRKMQKTDEKSVGCKLYV